MREKKASHIRLLKYGEEIGLSGTNWDSTCDWAIKNEILPKKNCETAYLFRDLFFECFTNQTGSSLDTWVLKNEYYFRLLEYRELCEARETSRQANRNAWFAIYISVIALLISSLIGYYQINSSININQAQVESIIHAINDFENAQMQTILTELRGIVDTKLVFDKDQLNKIIDSIKHSSNKQVTIDQRQVKEIVKALKDSIQ